MHPLVMPLSAIVLDVKKGRPLATPKPVESNLPPVLHAGYRPRECGNSARRHVWIRQAEVDAVTRR